MSEIAKLLRVAKRRNSADEYTVVSARILKKELEAVKRQLINDNVSMSVLIEAVLRGYANRHPAVLAMLDQWRRDEKREAAVPVTKSIFSKREVDSIYDDIGGCDTIDNED